MKAALVTGASRGIGKAFAEHLASKGYKVYAGMRQTSRNSLQNPQVIPIELDVTSDESIRKTAKLIKNQTDALHILVNNAGVDKKAATNNQPEQVTNLSALNRQALQYMFNVNAISPILVAQATVPIMTEPDSFIVNISSCRASFHDEITDPPGSYGYSASKIALNMLTKCLANELPQNVSTFAVHPGLVRTEMVPRGVMKPAESVEAIYSIIERWQPEYNGSFLRYDGSVYPL